jgi:hypothetical protein
VVTNQGRDDELNLWGLIAAVVCVAAGVFYVEFPFKTILGQ